MKLRARDFLDPLVPVAESARDEEGGLGGSSLSNSKKAYRTCMVVWKIGAVNRSAGKIKRDVHEGNGWDSVIGEGETTEGLKVSPAGCFTMLGVREGRENRPFSVRLTIGTDIRDGLSMLPG